MTSFDQLLAKARNLEPEEKRQLVAALRKELPPHPIEDRLMISAEGILEAFDRAGDFTIRMIRGVLAEGAFAAEVIPQLAPRWREMETAGDPPYDFLLTDTDEQRPNDSQIIRVQVKMQRSEGGVPLMADNVWKTRFSWPSDYFVAELQKSRKGEKAGKSTRPYRFGEFDVVAVSLGPSSGRWSDFTYTVANWLLPNTSHPDQILTFQPVAPRDSECWTTDFETAVGWFRSGIKKQIVGDSVRGPAKHK